MQCILTGLGLAIVIFVPNFTREGKEICAGEGSLEGEEGDRWDRGKEIKGGD